MARKPAKEIEAKKRLALEMDRSGSAADEISKAVGRHTKTVKTWLREAHGTSRTYKEVVEGHLQAGMSYQDAADAAGCSITHARRIERDARGWLKETHRTPLQMVADFVANPKAHQSDRFARSESFCRELLAHVYHELDNDPVPAGDLIDLATAQFELIRRSARSPAAVQKASCNLRLAKAFYAARERVLDQPAIALNTIRAVDPGACLACQAELARREALILRDLKQFPLALARLFSSSHAYKTMGHSGHDVLKNGLGTCAIAECLIHYYNGSPAVAVVVADRALERFVSPSEITLHRGLRFNKVLALLDLPGQAHPNTRALANGILAECGEKSSIPRLRSAFLAGRAAELEGDFPAAAAHFLDAYEDAQALKLPAGIGALLADIARVEPPDPGSLRERIRRLRDQRLRWLSPIAGALVSAFIRSEINFSGAITELRKSTGGDKFLPHSAAMAVG